MKQLVLNYTTCTVCGSHRFNTLSSNAEYAVRECRCGYKEKVKMQSIKVDYPDVIILGESFPKLNTEKEIFFNDFNFGANAIVKYHDQSVYVDECIFNIHEFHFLYQHYPLGAQVAFESNIHMTGCTRDIASIKSIEIREALMLHEECSVNT